MELSNPLLTRPEAAARARIAVRTLDSLFAQGKGPTITRIGRRLLISQRDLDAWLDSMRETEKTRVAA